MESPFRLVLAILLTAPLCACVAYKPPVSSSPHRIGRRAEGPIVQQAEKICNKEAAKSASAGVTLLMQLMQ
jgi:hypothetical protein